EGKNWAQKINEVFHSLDNVQGVEFELSYVAFELFKQPLSADKIEKIQDNKTRIDAHFYAKWHKKRSELITEFDKASAAKRQRYVKLLGCNPKQICGYQLAKLRVVMICFSSNAFNEAVVKIRKHGEANYLSVNDDKEFTVRDVRHNDANELVPELKNLDEMYAAKVFANGPDLPNGKYDLDISFELDPDRHKGMFEHLGPDAQEFSYTLTVDIETKYSALSSEIAVINGDPISVEEATLKQFPQLFAHLKYLATIGNGNPLSGSTKKGGAAAGLPASVTQMFDLGKLDRDHLQGFISSSNKVELFAQLNKSLTSLGVVDANSNIKNALNVIEKYNAVFLEDWEQKVLDAIKNTGRKGVFEGIGLKNPWLNPKMKEELNGTYLSKMGVSPRVQGAYLLIKDVLKVYTSVSSVLSTHKALDAASLDFNVNLANLEEGCKHYLQEVAEQLTKVQLSEVEDSSYESEYEKTGHIAANALGWGKIMPVIGAAVVYNKLSKEDLKFNPYIRVLSSLGVESFSLDVKFVKGTSTYLNPEQAAQALKQFADNINRAGEGLLQHIVIEGHASIEGSRTYNLELSALRARAVVDSLVSDFAVDENIIEPIGRGAPLNNNKVDPADRCVIAKVETMDPKQISFMGTCRNKSDVLLVQTELSNVSLKKLDKANYDLIKLYFDIALDVGIALLSILPPVAIGANGIRASLTMGRMLKKSRKTLNIIGVAKDAATASKELAGSVTELLDATILEGVLAKQNANDLALVSMNESSYLNQRLLKEAFICFKNTTNSDLRKQKYLEVQMRLRYEAINGLVGLLQRAACETNQTTKYLDKLAEYNVDTYIKKFILTGGWLYPAHHMLPTSMDEYWIFLNKQHQIEQNVGKTSGTLSYLAQLLNDDSNSKVHAVETLYHHDMYSSLSYMMSTVQHDVPNYIQADFHQLFPIHYLSSKKLDYFATIFKPVASELDRDAVEYMNIKVRDRGVKEQDAWRDIELTRGWGGWGELTKESILSPFHQIRIIVVLDKYQTVPKSGGLRVVEAISQEGSLADMIKDKVVAADDSKVEVGNKHYAVGKKDDPDTAAFIDTNDTEYNRLLRDPRAIYPFKVRLNRVEGFDTAGPEYNGIMKVLEKEELLDDEQQYAGRIGAIIYPYYQFGPNTILGIRPLDNWNQISLDSEGFLYQIQRYSFNMVLAGVSKNNFNITYQCSTNDEKAKENDELYMNVDSSREHIIPPYIETTDGKLIRDKTAGSPMIRRDEALLLDDDFLKSTTTHYDFPKLFDGNVKTDILVQAGGDKFLHEIVDTDHKSPSLSYFRKKVESTKVDYGRGALNADNFDWNKPVRVISIITCDSLELKNYKAISGAEFDENESKAGRWVRVPAVLNLTHGQFHKNHKVEFSSIFSYYGMGKGLKVGSTTEAFKHLGNYDPSIVPPLFDHVCEFLKTQEQVTIGDKRHVFVAEFDLVYQSPVVDRKINGLIPYKPEKSLFNPDLNFDGEKDMAFSFEVSSAGDSGIKGAKWKLKHRVDDPEETQRYYEYVLKHKNEAYYADDGYMGPKGQEVFKKYNWHYSDDDAITVICNFPDDKNNNDVPWLKISEEELKKAKDELKLLEQQEKRRAELDAGKQTTIIKKVVKETRLMRWLKLTSVEQAQFMAKWMAGKYQNVDKLYGEMDALRKMENR
ncbi:MAG: OmpA family protein, partial [Gammaproteobacteria bacterium]|nr:OmpA family protein [Gammaproteobacteria bacterium]